MTYTRSYIDCTLLTYEGYLWMSEACRGDVVVIHYMRTADDILNSRYPLSNAKDMLKIKQYALSPFNPYYNLTTILY